MAKRLSIKYRKRRRDIGSAQKKANTPKKHKVARARSRKAKMKKRNPA